jgi:hypothetical protein
MHDCMDESRGGWSGGWVFFLPFVLVVPLVSLNLFIAIILDNFSAVTRIQKREEGDDVVEDKDKDRTRLIKTGKDKGLSDDLLMKFKAAWALYDPLATHFLPTSSLEDFIQDLEPPLGTGPEPPINEIMKRVSQLAIRNHRGGQGVHFTETLYALTRYLCGDVGLPPSKLQEDIHAKLENRAKIDAGEERSHWMTFGVYIVVTRAQRVWKERSARRKAGTLVMADTSKMSDAQALAHRRSSIHQFIYGKKPEEMRTRRPSVRAQSLDPTQPRGKALIVPHKPPTLVHQRSRSVHIVHQASRSRLMALENKDKDGHNNGGNSSTNGNSDPSSTSIAPTSGSSMTSPPGHTRRSTVDHLPGRNQLSSHHIDSASTMSSKMSALQRMMSPTSHQLELQALSEAHEEDEAMSPSLGSNSRKFPFTRALSASSASATSSKTGAITSIKGISALSTSTTTTAATTTTATSITGEAKNETSAAATPAVAGTGHQHDDSLVDRASLRHTWGRRDSAALAAHLIAAATATTSSPSTSFQGTHSAAHSSSLAAASSAMTVHMPPLPSSPVASVELMTAAPRGSDKKNESDIDAAVAALGISSSGSSALVSSTIASISSSSTPTVVSSSSSGIASAIASQAIYMPSSPSAASIVAPSSPRPMSPLTSVSTINNGTLSNGSSIPAATTSTTAMTNSTVAGGTVSPSIGRDGPPEMARARSLRRGQLPIGALTAAVANANANGISPPSSGLNTPTHRSAPPSPPSPAAAAASAVLGSHSGRGATVNRLPNLRGSSQRNLNSAPLGSSSSHSTLPPPAITTLTPIPSIGSSNDHGNVGVGGSSVMTPKGSSRATRARSRSGSGEARATAALLSSASVGSPSVTSVVTPSATTTTPAAASPSSSRSSAIRIVTSPSPSIVANTARESTFSIRNIASSSSSLPSGTSSLVLLPSSTNVTSIGGEMPLSASVPWRANTTSGRKITLLIRPTSSAGLDASISSTVIHSAPVSPMPRSSTTIVSSPLVSNVTPAASRGSVMLTTNNTTSHPHLQ